MKIGTYRWDRVSLSDVARLTYAARQSELEERGITPEKLEELFRENFAEAAPAFALASLDDNLVGLLLLYRTSPTSMVLNPGQILGGHPVVFPGNDYRPVASELLQEAIDWARHQDIERIELTVATTNDGKLETDYDTFYEAFGFGKEEEYVEMICHLAGQTDRDTSLSWHLQTKPLSDVPVDELYQCYYEAFSSGDASFFFQQVEQEKREFFDTLGIAEAMSENASLALAQDERLVGFSFVLPYGDENCHISCMCIHPDYMGQGLGKRLLYLIMRRALEQGYKTITLGTDVNMKAFELYRKNGFEIMNGSTIYRWRKPEP